VINNNDARRKPEIELEGTMFIYFIYLLVGHLQRLSGDEIMHSGEWKEY